MQKQQQVEADHSTLAVSTMKQKLVPLRWYRWRRRVALPYLFLAPFLLLFILFFILPLGYALGISLFADRLVGGTVFVGSQNYLQAFQDSSFWEGVRHMLLFMVVQVPVMLCLALTFALLLDSGVTKLRTLFRLGFFLPYAIPSVVAALLWGYLYSPNFVPFAQIASSLHLPPPGFLTDSGLLASIGTIVTWQWTGSTMIILSAALQAIPPELYEPPLVDAPPDWKVHRYINIPFF